MLFEIADGAHDLGSIEGMHLAWQDDEVGAQRRLDQDIAIIAGGVDDDDVIAVQPIDRLGEGLFIRRAHEVHALWAQAARDR